MTAQGTPPDDAQTTGRPGRDRTGPPGAPGVPQPHPRDRRTRPKDPAVMGPTSSGQSNWAVQTPGSRRPTTGSRPPSAWPTASTTRTIPSPSSCSAAADSTYAHHNQEPNPRKQQKPHMYWTFLRREGGVTAALRCENARLHSWALAVALLDIDRRAGNHGASDNHDTPLLTYRRSMVL